MTSPPPQITEGSRPPGHLSATGSSRSEFSERDRVDLLNDTSPTLGDYRYRLPRGGVLPGGALATFLKSSRCPRKTSSVPRSTSRASRSPRSGRRRLSGRQGHRRGMADPRRAPDGEGQDRRGHGHLARPQGRGASAAPATGQRPRCRPAEAHPSGLAPHRRRPREGCRGAHADPPTVRRAIERKAPSEQAASRTREAGVGAAGLAAPLLQAREVGEVGWTRPQEIAHGLGRVPKGWLLVDPDVAATTWRTAKTSETLTLGASASVRHPPGVVMAAPNGSSSRSPGARTGPGPGEPPGDPWLDGRGPQRHRGPCGPVHQAGRVGAPASHRRGRAERASAGPRRHRRRRAARWTPRTGSFGAGAQGAGAGSGWEACRSSGWSGVRCCAPLQRCSVGDHPLWNIVQIRADLVATPCQRRWLIRRLGAGPRRRNRRADRTRCPGLFSNAPHLLRGRFCRGNLLDCLRRRGCSDFLPTMAALAPAILLWEERRSRRSMPAVISPHRLRWAPLPGPNPLARISGTPLRGGWRLLRKRHHYRAR